MFFEIFIQMMPYLAVFAVLGYIGRAQQKKAKEREEEQKKGIIRTCYVVKTEKILTTKTSHTPNGTCSLKIQYFS